MAMNDDETSGVDARLKKIQRNPVRFDLFALYAEYGRTRDEEITGPQFKDDFFRNVSVSLDESLGNEAFLHGQRTQAMFEAVVVSLGEVRMIRIEDAGGGWYAGAELKVPDFRIVTRTGKQMLVEVKNWRSGINPLTFKETYIEALRRYGEVTNSPVYIAVYWSNLVVWTLIGIEDVTKSGNRYVLPIEDALRLNDMQLLGDCMIGTRYPLVFRMIADRASERTMSRDSGVANMTIGEARIECAGNLIADEREQSLAMAFMMFGKWHEEERLEWDEDGFPDAIVYEYNPEEDVTDKDFGILGSLSEMSSKWFALSTQDEDRLTKIGFDLEPEYWKTLLPGTGNGQALPLWRFVIHPNRT